MSLLDSNIIINACKIGEDSLRELIAEEIPSTSVVSYIEVLGYHQLTDQDRTNFEAFFSSITVLPISGEIVERAVKQTSTDQKDELRRCHCGRHSPGTSLDTDHSKYEGFRVGRRVDTCRSSGRDLIFRSIIVLDQQSSRSGYEASPLPAEVSQAIKVR